MIDYDDMPEDNEDLKSLDVSFPTLDPNTAASCPRPMADLVEYVNAESPEGDPITAADFEFLRTAQVAETKYWIWRYREDEDEEYYLTVSQDEDGSTCAGFEGNDYELSPEQFLLGDYHECF